MTEAQPNRRWFQWRLSTWFVLIAILAWALVTPLYIITGHREKVPGSHPESGRRIAVTNAHVPGSMPPTEYTVFYQRWNPWFPFPPLALAGFLLWKFAWRLVERRRERSGGTG